METPAALVVDEIGHRVGVLGLDVLEAGAAWEPTPPVPVLVLDLASLPPRMRVAEPAVEVKGRNESFPVGPFGSLVEGDRAAQVGRDALDGFAQPCKRSVGAVALGHGDEHGVASDSFSDAFSEAHQGGAVPSTDQMVGFPVADLAAVAHLTGPQPDVRQCRALVGVTGLAGSPGSPAPPATFGWA